MSSEIEHLRQLHTRPGFLLRRAHQIAVAIFEDSFAALDMTPSQYAVLIAVNEIERPNQNDVALALGLNKVSVSQVVQGLEKRGWLTRRTAADDRRQRQLFLTAAGRKALAKSAAMANDAYEALLEPFGGPERQMMLSLLQRVVSELDHRARAPLELRVNQQDSDAKAA